MLSRNSRLNTAEASFDELQLLNIAAVSSWTASSSPESPFALMAKSFSMALNDMYDEMRVASLSAFFRCSPSISIFASNVTLGSFSTLFLTSISCSL